MRPHASCTYAGNAGRSLLASLLLLLAFLIQPSLDFGIRDSNESPHYMGEVAEIAFQLQRCGLWFFVIHKGQNLAG